MLQIDANPFCRKNFGVGIAFTDSLWGHAISFLRSSLQSLERRYGRIVDYGGDGYVSHYTICLGPITSDLLQRRPRTIDGQLTVGKGRAEEEDCVRGHTDEGVLMPPIILTRTS